MTTHPPVALTIAGSDSGGGAGIQADLATFAAYGVHGTSAVTAVTVQDTTGVHRVHALPADLVAAQAEAVLADLPVSAVKTGMLGDADVVRVVSMLAARGLLPRLVVDPVLVSTSGHALATAEAASAMASQLLPQALLATPNTDEAAALLGARPAESADEQREQAEALRRLGPTAVVVTGRRDGLDRVDVLATPERTIELRAPSITTTNDHGTGCTFASAAAAALARGAPVEAAVRSAGEFVRLALLRSSEWRLGRGRGPVSHLHHPPLDPLLHASSDQPLRRNA
ncbi:MAG TPA: bifunctional hydroxymethylpyrimidine kinase/phosphomethylpyrimidine kinase [Intrasporangium sp.]|uniref:bifunctional hydroxymethylpyrimidine kinase/phosphomethylpyrimidine kinase n=1 Tax=Intrasporangium sp. TaxID=1925024 RepID=UPI002D7839B7|nr:bifunctional hydroxymethylpyrimidine kinase/phosphomethylpyrimidine kinase [Intrasporangium sp.]HET7397720.1 bifunctional hydroxymethylpyrimidine kinase/phosphomethylpyrimidine kinase [Intrasporangium sp.]